jgi:anti-sigma factor RsiW
MSLDDEIAGIKCAEVLASLSNYVDGELADDVRQRIEAHVIRCTNCERFGGMFGQVVRAVRSQAAHPDDAAAFERLRRRLGDA